MNSWRKASGLSALGEVRLLHCVQDESVCITTHYTFSIQHKTACDSIYKAEWEIEGYGQTHTLRNNTKGLQEIMKITSLLEMLQSQRLQNRRVKINESHQMTACSSVFNNRYRSSSLCLLTDKDYYNEPTSIAWWPEMVCQLIRT